MRERCLFPIIIEPRVADYVPLWRELNGTYLPARARAGKLKIRRESIAAHTSGALREGGIFGARPPLGRCLKYTPGNYLLEILYYNGVS